jgi:hypothetical protein
VTGKEIVDSLLRLLEIVLSWPLAVLVVILLVRRHVPVMIAELSQRLTKAPSGWEFMREIREELTTVREELTTVRKGVERLEERIAFEPSEALTPRLQTQLEAALSAFQDYFHKLGYETKSGQIAVSVRPKVEGYANYDGSLNRINLDASVGDDSDVMFREYAHHVLGSLAGVRFESWPRVQQEIEHGLADYFPCSYNNDPLLAGKFARQALDRPYVRNLDNTRNFSEQPSSSDTPHDQGEVWGAVFWEIRHLLGQEKADRLLFSAWAADPPSRRDGGRASSFARLVIETSRTLDQGRHVEQIREVFEHPGLKL